MRIMSKEQFNKEYKIVYQPKEKEAYNNNRRFAVGAGRLAHYIGEENAKTCFEKAEKMKTDKVRFKFRKMGIVDFYLI